MPQDKDLYALRLTVNLDARASLAIYCPVSVIGDPNRSENAQRLVAEGLSCVVWEEDFD